MTRLWTELPGAPEFGELSPETIAILPVGSAEQHGPHLPLNTDFVVADSLARDVAARYGDELGLMLLPSLAVSKSNEHAWSPGTLWLSAPTLLAVLDEIARCVATTPVRKLVFLNGHGGNSALLQVASRDVRLAHGLQTFVMHPSVPPDHGGTSPAAELGMGIHAGVEETSVMLHLRPDLGQARTRRAQRCRGISRPSSRYRIRQAGVVRLAEQRLRDRRDAGRPDRVHRRAR